MLSQLLVEQGQRKWDLDSLLTPFTSLPLDCMLKRTANLVASTQLRS